MRPAARCSLLGVFSMLVPGCIDGPTEVDRSPATSHHVHLDTMPVSLDAIPLPRPFRFEALAIGDKVDLWLQFRGCFPDSPPQFVITRTVSGLSIQSSGELLPLPASGGYLAFQPSVSEEEMRGLDRGFDFMYSFRTLCTSHPAVFFRVSAGVFRGRKGILPGATCGHYTRPANLYAGDLMQFLPDPRGVGEKHEESTSSHRDGG
jgi:hypothetical protein